jgi:type I restriction enzyme S subunit
MILVAPDHIQSGTGSLLAKETSATQGAISGKYLFTPGNIVYSKIRPYLRKAILADFEGLCSADMYPLQPREGITPRYLLAVMLSENFSRFAEIVSMRSGFPKINREELAEYWAPVPPPLEQSRIAEILDTVDEAIRQSEQLIAKLKQMKQGLLHDLLTRGIDDNGELRDPDRHPEQFQRSPLGCIPRKWKVISLGSVLEGIDAGRSPNCPDHPAPPGEWGVLKVSAVRPEGFAPRENKLLPRPSLANPSHEVRDGDLLITRANTYELVGLTCLVEHPPPRLLLCDKTLRLRLSSEVAPFYIFFASQMPYVRRQIEIHATGSSGSMKNIGQSAIRNLRFLLPAWVEQERIVERIRSIDRGIDDEKTESHKLRLLKQGLMEDLLTGRVRVTELAPAP